MAACLDTAATGFDLSDKSEQLRVNNQAFASSEENNHESIMILPSCSEGFMTSDKNIDKNIDKLNTCDFVIDTSVNAANNSNTPQFFQNARGKSSRKNLRVSFPEGNEVSGYMDPPIPWDDASSCTTEVLVSAYLKSCEKFGVRPIQRLLNQLQAIANFQERNETLTLRNDHLDYRHCETLEEVLRRVQFRTIDLEATKMDDEAAVVMFDMLEYYESCIKLNISFTRSFGARGWQACARLIKKTSCLEQLDVQSCNLSDHLMPFMGRALKIGTSLVSLHLENNAMSGKSLMTLVMILKTNETLRELHLADNRIGPTDAIQLSSLIKYNKTIKALDLRNNQIQDVGLGHLCEGIVEQGASGRGLETLVLWSNQLSYHSMNSMCRAVMDSKSLLDINLGRNNITNEGIHRIKEGLLKNRILLRLRLQAVKISCEGAVAIAEYLAETRKLVRVDLRDNDIKTGGLMALTLAMKVNRSVLRVDLDKEPKKESGVKDYINQQKNLLVDIFSYVDRNCKLASKLEEERKCEEIKNMSSTLSQIISPTSEESHDHKQEGWSLVGEHSPSNMTQPSPENMSSSPSSPLPNSNNSSRDKLHLELLPSEPNKVVNSDLPVEPASPSSTNNFSIPLSPVVIYQGTASLMPVSTNGVFSPEGKMTREFEDDFERIESNEVETFHAVESDPKDGKLKKSGKMPREKRKKFVVTKTPPHYHHHHHLATSNPKKQPPKNVRRTSNVTMETINAIDKTANAITSTRSEDSPTSFTSPTFNQLENSRSNATSQCIAGFISEGRNLSESVGCIGSVVMATSDEIKQDREIRFVQINEEKNFHMNGLKENES